MRACLVAAAVVQLAAAAPSSDARSFEVEIRAVREGVTAAEWLAAHPGDAIEPFDGRTGAHDTDLWCVRARAEGRLADGGAWTRTAYFYDPEPPADLALPRGPEARLRGGCRLGLVWLEAPPAARDALVDAMTAVAGPGTRAEEVLPPWWKGTRSWSAGAFRGLVALMEKEPFFPERRPSAVTRLSLPAWDRAGWEDAHGDDDAAAGMRAQVAALTTSVAAVRGIDVSARDAMLALLSGHDFYDGTPPVTTAEVVAAFARWTRALEKLPAEERAAALLVADSVMRFVSSIGWGPSDDDGVRTARPIGPPPFDSAGMRVAGATFVWQPLGGAWAYAGSFLEDAIARAPPGPSRDRALVRRLAGGFNPSGMCDAGDDEFEAVISAGEPLVRRLRDPELLAQAHFVLGDAYATIVSLASAPVGEYSDPKVYAPRAQDARERALAHYRAGLALDRASGEAREAWRWAWRLAAGLPPPEPRYFCVYD